MQDSPEERDGAVEVIGTDPGNKSDPNTTEPAETTEAAETTETNATAKQTISSWEKLKTLSIAIDEFFDPIFRNILFLLVLILLTSPAIVIIEALDGDPFSTQFFSSDAAQEVLIFLLQIAPTAIQEIPIVFEFTPLIFSVGLLAFRPISPGSIMAILSIAICLTGWILSLNAEFLMTSKQPIVQDFADLAFQDLARVTATDYTKTSLDGLETMLSNCRLIFLVTFGLLVNATINKAKQEKEIKRNDSS